METNVRILRLHNGDDIICNLEMVDDNTVTAHEPMFVDLKIQGKNQGLMMCHWLPVQIIKENKIDLKYKDFFGPLVPSDDLTEYYLDTVDKIKDIVKNKSVITDDEHYLKEIALAYEQLNDLGNVLH